MVLKKTNFGLLADLALPNHDVWNYKLLSIYVYLCVSVECHIGQSFWLNWPMVSSANAIGLHLQHC